MGNRHKKIFQWFSRLFFAGLFVLFTIELLTSLEHVTSLKLQKRQKVTSVLPFFHNECLTFLSKHLWKERIRGEYCLLWGDCKLLVILLQGTFDYCSLYFWPLAKDEMILCIQFASIQNFKKSHENIFLPKIEMFDSVSWFFQHSPTKKCKKEFLALFEKKKQEWNSSA